MDFTLFTYTKLIEALKSKRFSFSYYSDVSQSSIVILRHDVDRLPQNALKIAQIEKNLGVQSTFYFRIVNHVFRPDLIQQIAGLGHEIGYHYEDFNIAVKSIKNEKLIINNEEEIAKVAIKLFERHLAELRKYYPVKTICMHGSPFSKYDNRLLWKYYNYKDYGIEFEPYYDLDYNDFFYITDTGRQWNNKNVSIRDKVISSFNINIRNTKHLIKLIEENKLPNQIIINCHPQRWFDPGINWIKELLLQTIKNQFKIIINHHINNTIIKKNKKNATTNTTIKIR